MVTVALSYPVEVKCADKYCPTRKYAEQHTHTLYNNYTVDADLYVPGMGEAAVSLIAETIDPYATAPISASKGVLQNV